MFDKNLNIEGKTFFIVEKELLNVSQNLNCNIGTERCEHWFRKCDKSVLVIQNDNGIVTETCVPFKIELCC